MPSKNVSIQLRGTYLAMIRNSVGSKLWRNYLAVVDGKESDIMRNGRLACAWYASSILLLLGLIHSTHTTVGSTIADLKRSGWKSIRKPKPGCILVWEEVDFGNSDLHQHIGFYLGNHRAMSNRWQDRSPAIHHWTFGTAQGKSKRRITAMYWNSKLH